MRRLPTTLVLVAIAAGLLLAACGSPITPATLALTGVTPQLALPGDTVTLSGSAFATGQAVTFDGVPVTVASVAADGTSMAVVVPDTAGYPVIAVEDVALEDALFVGHAYAGPLTLEGIQAALDPLPEGAALRVGAGAYAGTELTLDNRSLYGAGPSTILQPTTGLLVLARSQTTAVLADLRVEGGDLIVSRGRLTTAAAEPPAGFATVHLADLELDLGALRTPGADFIEVILRDSVVDAANVDGIASHGQLRIERSTVGSGSTIVAQNLHGITVVDAQLTAAAGQLVLNSGDRVEVTRSGLVGPDGVTLGSQVGPLALDEATIAADGPIQLQTAGGLDLQDADLTSVTDAVVIVAQDGVKLSNATLSAGTTLIVQAPSGETRLDGSTLTAATDLQFVSQGAIAIDTTALTATAGSIVLQALTGLDVTDATLTSGATITAQSTLGSLTWRSTAANAVGPMLLFTEGWSRVVASTFASTTGALDVVGGQQLDVTGSTIEVEGQVALVSSRGATSVLDTDVTTAAGTAVVHALGAVVVEGGIVTAPAGAVVLVSHVAGDVTLRGSNGIAADTVLISAGTQTYIGNNGTVTIVGNGPISATTALLVDTPYSDLIVAGNGPIFGGTVSVAGGRSHVTLRDNERLESGADLTVAAPDPGGRITATGNAFVANAGAGTITLDTVAGALTQSDNVFTGTTSFPNNP
jgi:hypothetical protein